MNQNEHDTSITNDMAIDLQDEQALWDALEKVDLDDLMTDETNSPLALAEDIERFEANFSGDAQDSTTPSALLVSSAAATLTASAFHRPDDQDPTLIRLKNRAYALATETVTRVKNMRPRDWIAALLTSAVMGLGGFSAVYALSPFENASDGVSDDFQLTESSLFSDDSLWSLDIAE